MAERDLAQALIDKEAELTALRAQLADAQAQAALAPPPPAPYPRLVYRAGGKKGQIDHPGNDVQRIENEDEHARAAEEGWQDEPVPYYAEPEPEPEPVATAKTAKTAKR